MRHKPPLPTEGYTVSCHCTFSHSKPWHNKILSLSTSFALLLLKAAFYVVSVYIAYVYIFPCLSADAFTLCTF